VRYFNDQPLIDATTVDNPHPMSKRMVYKVIESTIIKAPNPSLASNIDDFSITVSEDLEDSDYVSTLRDVNEDEW